jgi:hypothetical protein
MKKNNNNEEKNVIISTENNNKGIWKILPTKKDFGAIITKDEEGSFCVKILAPLGTNLPYWGTDFLWKFLEKYLTNSELKGWESVGQVALRIAPFLALGTSPK